MRTIQIKITDVEKHKQTFVETTIFQLNEIAQQTNCDPLRLLVIRAIEELDKNCDVKTQAIESHLMF